MTWLFSLRVRYSLIISSKIVINFAQDIVSEEHSVALEIRLTNIPEK